MHLLMQDDKGISGIFILLVRIIEHEECVCGIQKNLIYSRIFFQKIYMILL